jgi:hypothetical protein
MWLDERSGEGVLDVALLRRLRAGPIAEYSDLEAAIARARLLHEQFPKFGVDSTHEIDDPRSREALRTLRGVTVLRSGRRGVTVSCGPEGSHEALILGKLRDALADLPATTYASGMGGQPVPARGV